MGEDGSGKSGQMRTGGGGVVSQMWMSTWKKNYSYHICEQLHFCFANHACVSHLLRAQPHLLGCYYRNCLIGTHMCVHLVSEWSVFYPSVWIFTSCNVSNNVSLASARREVGVGGGWWSTKYAQAWTGEGAAGLKNSQICVDILYGWPLRGKKC